MDRLLYREIARIDMVPAVFGQTPDLCIDFGKQRQEH